MKSFKPLVPTILALLVAMAADTAAAQAVYRCGNSYSQTPCANGTLVPTEDPRSQAQRQQAKEALAQDRQLAKEMETSRQKEEALAFQREQAQRAAHERLAAAQAKADAKTNRGTKAHKNPGGLRTVKVQQEGVFTATVEQAPKKKPKAKSRTP